MTIYYFQVKDGQFMINLPKRVTEPSLDYLERQAQKQHRAWCNEQYASNELKDERKKRVILSINSVNVETLEHTKLN
jgi:hypothetical protein